MELLQGRPCWFPPLSMSTLASLGPSINRSLCCQHTSSNNSVSVVIAKNPLMTRLKTNDSLKRVAKYGAEKPQKVHHETPIDPMAPRHTPCALPASSASPSHRHFSFQQLPSCAQCFVQEIWEVNQKAMIHSKYI